MKGKNKKIIKFFLILILLNLDSNAQSKIDSTKSVEPINENFGEVSGVSVSPSLLRFNAKAGTVQTKTFKIHNYLKRKILFQIFFQDFGLAKDEKTEVAKKPEEKYSLSKYLNISDNFLELKPGDSRNITITANIPDNENGYVAMWTNLIIDEVTERGKLELPGNNPNTIALGITAGIGFMIQITQNPPNVVLNNVEIIKLSIIKNDPINKNKGINIVVKNKGDGIGYCLYYLELTNLATGKTRKFRVNQFGVLPNYEKEVKFIFPNDLPRGKYSGIAVIDFGDASNLQTAEIEFDLN